jgi:DNA-directed RNA polymerase specialized sigma subunit
MHSPTLEEDLQRYAKCRKQTTYNKIHIPLIYLIKWIVAKVVFTPISSYDYQDIEQLCLLRVIRDIKYWRPEKGKTALSFVRMIITQEIRLRCHKLKKIENKTELYNGNKDNRTNDSTLSDNQPIDLSDYQQRLISYSTVVSDKQFACIVRVISKSLDNQSVQAMRYKDRLNYYASKSNRTVNQVIRCIKEIRAYSHKDF